MPMPRPMPKDRPRVPTPIEEGRAIAEGERSHTLYRMFDAADQLLYVGISGRGPRRFSEHRASQRWWREVATIKVEHYELALEAEAAEREAIETERPRFNVVHARAAA